MKKIITFLVLINFLGVLFLPIASAEEAVVNPSPVYVFWNKADSYRYLTTSESERKNFLESDRWKNEGVFWQAYSSKQNESVPVYKIKDITYKCYFYTASEETKNKFIETPGWKFEGIAFYASNKEQPNMIPVYVIRNSDTEKYFYTSTLGEKNCKLIDKSWRDYGIAFWVPEENANISEDNYTCQTVLGPEINVGLWSYNRSDLKENSFKIYGNKAYVIKNKDGSKIAEVSANNTTKVKYNGDKNFLIYDSISKIELNKEVSFEAKDGNNFNLIFNISRPDSPYDKYRGKIKLKYNNIDENIWVINTLPIEQYTWGMGETTGTGPLEHTKVMTVIFRTYGYWYKKYATKYLKYGFTIKSDTSSQIYRGYEWEDKHPNIKESADQTRGIIAKYNDEIALTPYSSWSDGKTRSFKEHWGSNDYPWCKSVKDPYGKNSSQSTKQLQNAGNHMVGLIANGSLKLAGNEYKKKYDWILKYYYSKILLQKMY